MIGIIIFIIGVNVGFMIGALMAAVEMEDE